LSKAVHFGALTPEEGQRALALSYALVVHLTEPTTDQTAAAFVWRPNGWAAQPPMMASIWRWLSRLAASCGRPTCACRLRLVYPGCACLLRY